MLLVLSKTFNAITVDSDTSTNDMVAIFSTKKIKSKKLNTASSKEALKFEATFIRIGSSIFGNRT